MKVNFLIDKEQDRDFIYGLANKNMSEWAVDLETAQAMAQDIVAYSAEIARLKAQIGAMRRCEICKHYDNNYHTAPCIICARTTDLQKWELAKC
jgi:hypothetical protein